MRAGEHGSDVNRVALITAEQSVDKSSTSTNSPGVPSLTGGPEWNRLAIVC
jgi:hypothetical protein